jgi:hypothetical protein
MRTGFSAAEGATKNWIHDRQSDCMHLILHVLSGWMRMDMKNTWLVQLHTLEVPARPRQGVLVLAWELNVPRARWHAALALIRSRRRQSAPGLVSPSRFTYELAVRPEADRAVRTLLPRALTRLGVGALCMCTETSRIVSAQQCRRAWPPRPRERRLTDQHGHQ